MLIRADMRDGIPLADESVDCVVTSPPYWGLRDYGLAPGWWPAVTFCPMAGLEPVTVPGMECCLGLEPEPLAFVGHMVAVFREVRRALKRTGVCWLNLGDCYATGAWKVGDCPGGGKQGEHWKAGYRGNHADDPKRAAFAAAVGPMSQPNRMPQAGLKPKDLLGMPWRVAFALQAEGWWLRMDNIWAKNNPMPESVRDRTTRSHEYLFHLTKSGRYYWDHAAIREEVSEAVKRRPNIAYFKEDRPEVGLPRNGRRGRRGAIRSNDLETYGLTRGTTNACCAHPEGKNKRSVWEVATQPYPGAHFATFPEKLVEPCVLAGCPEGGVVLDPFCGSGTTVLVAERLGRRGIGCELSAAYMAQARVRTAQRYWAFSTTKDTEGTKEGEEIE